MIMTRIGNKTAWGQKLHYLYNRMQLKHTAKDTDLNTDLHRCLSTWQLTLLGLGSTIGVGIYVMLGVMAKENAGPSVIISFAIAILVTLMNAMVYAEFSTHIPHTGASYIYLYKVFGEFAAFIMGSLTMLSGLLTTCVGARAWSGMLDSFFNNTIQEQTIAAFGQIQFGPPFAETVDITAFLFQLAVTLLVSLNISCTSFINTVLGILTTSVLVFVLIAGLIFGDIHTFANAEHGGFFPFGMIGVVRAASLALYATSGFEMVSMSAEEAKDPGKSIPYAIIAELSVVGTVYIGAAVGMLFLIPYWMIDLRAPLPSAFEYAGLHWGKMIVTIGPLFGITNLQMLGLYGVSRCTYRMSKDRLFFSFFVAVDKKTGSPRRAVLFTGILIAIFALLCDLTYMVKINVILMLLNYISVGPALIMLKIKESIVRKRPITGETPLDNDHTDKKQDMSIDTLTAQDNDSCKELITKEDMCGNFKMRTDASEERDKSDGLSSMDVAIHTQIDERIDNGPYSDSDENCLNDSSLTGRINICSDKAKGYSYTKKISPRKQCQMIEKSNEVTIARYQSSEPNQRKINKTTLVLDRISPWMLVTLHYLLCTTLAAQVVFGQEDILSHQPLALFSMVLLVTLLIVISYCIRLFITDEHAKDKFQTPLMPLVPSMSIFLSSSMLFSASEMDGFIEVAVLALIVIVLYVVITLMRHQREQSAMTKGLEENVKDDQMVALLSPED